MNRPDPNLEALLEAGVVDWLVQLIDRYRDRCWPPPYGVPIPGASRLWDLLNRDLCRMNCLSLHDWYALVKYGRGEL